MIQVSPTCAGVLHQQNSSNKILITLDLTNSLTVMILSKQLNKFDELKIHHVH